MTHSISEKDGFCSYSPDCECPNCIEYKRTIQKDRVLIIVDMINDFIDKKGSLYVPNSEKLIPNINALGRKFSHVIIVSDSHSKNDPEFQIFPPHAIVGTNGCFVFPEISIREDKCNLLNKHTFSAFSNNEIFPILKNIQGNFKVKLYIVGVVTEICIRATTLDATKYGFKTYVITDAIECFDREKANYALLEMGNAGAIPITAKECLNER